MKGRRSIAKACGRSASAPSVAYHCARVCRPARLHVLCERLRVALAMKPYAASARLVGRVCLDHRPRMRVAARRSELDVSSAYRARLFVYRPRATAVGLRVRPLILSRARTRYRTGARNHNVRNRAIGCRHCLTLRCPHTPAAAPRSAYISECGRAATKAPVHRVGTDMIRAPK